MLRLALWETQELLTTSPLKLRLVSVFFGAAFAPIPSMVVAASAARNGFIENTFMVNLRHL
jgi:hypothetical protein